MRTRNSLTIALAVLIGAAAGALMVPIVRGYRALDRITAGEASELERGWRWMLAGDGHRARRWLGRINRRLEHAPDLALLEAGTRLRGADLWGWDRQSAPLVLRDAKLRASTGDRHDGDVVATIMASCPRTADATMALSVLQRLVTHPEPSIRQAGVRSACAWTGRARADRLATLRPLDEDTGLRRMLLLAAAWSTADAAPPPPTLGSPADVLEADLARHALRGGDVATIIDRLDRSGHERPIAVEDLLRRSSDPAALRLLQRYADAGNRTAAFALQSRRRTLEDDAARRVAGDAGAAPWRRRLALWRWDLAPAEIIEEVLAADPTEPDGSVYAAVLLAERRLGPEQAGDLAAAWIRDLDDDRKRAGALLAAVLGAHGDLLARAHEVEDMSAVRTAQRLALISLGRTAGPDDPIEFAYRTLHGKDGGFEPDTALCLLAAGYRDVIDEVVTSPERLDRTAIQPRAWLIERFVSGWHADAGRPIGGARHTVDLHFDLLRARWWLTRRNLVYDATRRVFHEAPADL